MSNNKLIMQQITELLHQHAVEVRSLKAKVRTLTRQRDQAQGSAREYRIYASKYQKQLAMLRKELRQNG